MEVKYLKRKSKMFRDLTNAHLILWYSNVVPACIVSINNDFSGIFNALCDGRNADVKNAMLVPPDLRNEIASFV